MRRTHAIPVVDIFAGPGGLGEGFSSLQTANGERVFKIALSIEKDSTAHQTLELRAFFRQFPPGQVPDAYYRHLAGEMSRVDLSNAFRTQSAAAATEAWCAELGKVREDLLHERIREAVGNSDSWVLIGGPPCQAYSLIGRARNSSRKDYRPEADERHGLYREYLRIIARHWPAVFVMENVKGLLSATLRQENVFGQIIADLSNPNPHLDAASRSYRIVPLTLPGLERRKDFRPKDFVVRAEDYGVPQRRHRVILVGIRNDVSGSPVPLMRASRRSTVEEAIGNLPRLRSGLSKGADSATTWLSALRSATTEQWFKELSRTDAADLRSYITDTLARLRPPRLGRGREFLPLRTSRRSQSKWFCDEELAGVCNHSTRGHITADLHRYLYSASFGATQKRSPSLGDFPEGLLPEHANVALALDGGMFGDRFRVQLRRQPSTTIASHIAKDGHYYVHFDPTQCRSLTVREAARLQTFPDNYFFCGPRTAQYQQVGNAVPPLLARQIAESILAALR